MRVQHLLWNKTNESAALIREQNERECKTPDKTHARECNSHDRTQRRGGATHMVKHNARECNTYDRYSAARECHTHNVTQRKRLQHLC